MNSYFSDSIPPEEKGIAPVTLLTLLLPNRCLFCKVLLKSGSCICNNCLAKIDIIDSNHCARCGAPSDRRGAEIGNFCEQCRELQFDFRKNRSLGVFKGDLRKLIHLYKFEGRRSIFRVFSHLSVMCKESYILSHEMIVPVPLSKRRYSERGFNQSFLIGREIAKKIPIPFFGGLLKRSGRARPQSSIESIHIRWSNMTDKFIVAPRYKELLRGKDILLIDDVLTTGATASACARTLYKCGAANVDLLSMARSVKISGYI